MYVVYTFLIYFTRKQKRNKKSKKLISFSQFQCVFLLGITFQNSGNILSSFRRIDFTNVMK